MKNPSEMYDDLRSARREGRDADAAALAELLHETAPGSRESITVKVGDLLDRGQYLDALYCVNSPEGEDFPELKAVCLYLLDDPLWEGIASSLEDSDNPHVSLAMRQLLGKA
jgi:hypothetical protein